MRKRKHISHDELKDALTFEDILGKDVYDEANDYIGVSNNIYIDPESMQVLGLAIDKGFIARGLVVGTAYVKRVTKHAIFLSMRPAFRMRGMTVYDKNGAQIGKVKTVELDEDSNNIQSFIVRTAFLRKNLRIGGDEIASVDDNIFLEKAMDELQAEEV